MIVKCTVCNTEFEAKRTTKKYCSIECMNMARRQKYAEAKTNGFNPTKRGIYEKQCLICGKTFVPKSSAANQRSCCYGCMPDGEQLTRGGFLAKIKQQRGGKCIRCGYNRCIKALEFHHLDPSKKDFTISNDHFKLADAVKESKKCILICSNCHKELHDGLWNINDLKLEEGEVKPYAVNE